MHSVVKIIAIGLMLGAGFFISDITNWLSASNRTIDLDEYCILSTQGCQKGEIKLALDRDVAQPLMPAKISVEWPDSQKDFLELQLEGLEMDMGQAKFLLTPTGNNTFSGEILLPVCTTDAMTWIGHISDGATTINTAVRMER